MANKETKLKELLPDYTLDVGECWRLTSDSSEYLSTFREILSEKLDYFFRQEHFTHKLGNIYTKNIEIDQFDNYNKQSVIVKTRGQRTVCSADFYIIGDKEFRQKMLENIRCRFRGESCW